MIAETLLALSLAANASPAPVPPASAAPQTAAPATATSAPTPTGRVLDRVAATVNGEPITLLDLEERGGSEVARAEAMPPGPDKDRAHARALKAAFDNVVAERLLDGQASSLGVDVTEAQ